MKIAVIIMGKNSFLPSVRHTTVGIHKQQVTLVTEKLTAPPKGEKALRMLSVHVSSILVHADEPDF